MSLRRAAAAFLLSVLAFGARAATDPGGPVLDYGNAHHFYEASPSNRLFIAITGRLKVSSKAGSWEYFALAEHPRESTFDAKVDAYSGAIEAVGASTVSFVVDRAGRAVVSRRFEKPTIPVWHHQCVASAFGAESAVRPRGLPLAKLKRIASFKELEAAARTGRRIVGVASYHLDGAEVTVDFPVRLVNINPRAGAPGVKAEEAWQLVSSRIPLYVGGDPACKGIRVGTAAFRSFDGPFDIVYLCGGSGKELSSSDYRCAKRIPGTLRLFQAAR